MKTSALKLYVVATLMAADCVFAACRTAAAKPRPIDPALPASAAPVTLPRGTMWLLFVDDLHLDFRNMGRLRNLLRKLSSELIDDGDTFGTRSSPSSLSIACTTDRTLLESAIRKATGHGLRASDILRITQGSVEPSEVRYRAAISLSAAYDAMLGLEHVHNQHKAFIYVSNGYSLDVSPDGSAAPGGRPPPLRQGRDVSVARLREQLSELTRLASRAGVTIFAIDPRILAGAEMPDPDVDRAAWDNYWTTTRNSLRVVSEQTGGFAILDEQNLVESLTRIRSAMCK